MLQVTDAKRLILRSSVRQEEKTEDEDDLPGIKPTSNSSARAALTHAFVTKKSRKAVKFVAESALLTRGADKVNSPYPMRYWRPYEHKGWQGNPWKKRRH